MFIVLVPGQILWNPIMIRNIIKGIYFPLAITFWKIKLGLRKEKTITRKNTILISFG